VIEEWCLVLVLLDLVGRERASRYPSIPVLGYEMVQIRKIAGSMILLILRSPKLTHFASNRQEVMLLIFN